MSVFLGFAALAVFLGAWVFVFVRLVAWDERQAARNAPPRADAVYPDPPAPAPRALACGVCTAVPAAYLCRCAGNCGSPRCQAGAVIYDMASALERITREGRRGPV